MCPSKGKADCALAGSLSARCIRGSTACGGSAPPKKGSYKLTLSTGCFRIGFPNIGIKVRLLIPGGSDPAFKWDAHFRIGGALGSDNGNESVERAMVNTADHTLSTGNSHRLREKKTYMILTVKDPWGTAKISFIVVAQNRPDQPDRLLEGVCQGALYPSELINRRHR